MILLLKRLNLGNITARTQARKVKNKNDEMNF
jgi:hypothetical protein